MDKAILGIAIVVNPLNDFTWYAYITDFMQ